MGDRGGEMRRRRRERACASGERGGEEEGKSLRFEVKEEEDEGLESCDDSPVRPIEG